MPAIDEWTYTPAWRDSDLAAELPTLAAVLAATGELVADDGESQVLRLLRGEQVFYLKRYPRERRLRSWFGRARIRQEARNQLWLNANGLPSATLVAYGESRVLCRTLRGALILTAVPNSRSLQDLKDADSGYLADRAWVARVSADLAAVVRRMHALHFRHNDLFWRNILVALDPAAPRVSLIDCPLGRVASGPLREHGRVKDFFCLARGAVGTLSRTQMLRFYLDYRERARLTAADRGFIRQVQARLALADRRRAKRHAKRAAKQALQTDGA